MRRQLSGIRPRCFLPFPDRLMPPLPAARLDPFVETFAIERMDEAIAGRGSVHGSPGLFGILQEHALRDEFVTAFLHLIRARSGDGCYCSRIKIGARHGAGFDYPLALFFQSL